MLRTAWGELTRRRRDAQAAVLRVPTESLMLVALIASERPASRSAGVMEPLALCRRCVLFCVTNVVS